MTAELHRRHDDRNFVSYGLSLVAGKRVRPHVRILSSFVAIATFFMGRGPLFRAEQRAYQNEVFDGIFQFAHPIAWGIGFWIVAAIMFTAAATGRALLMVVGCGLTTGILLAWAGGIITTAIISDAAVLTDGAVGLYVLAFTSIISIAFSPEPMEYEPIIVQADADGNVTPLKRVDRRAG